MTDLFTYIKDKNIAIDLNSKWFQELWYPLSKKTGSIITTRLLEWMGYSGEYKLQRQNFKRLLDNNNIPYEEIYHNDDRFLEHPSMIYEIEQTDKKQIKQKRWITLEMRNFKKAILRLNTKNAEVIRDYYLNLEEACFDYAEYQVNWLRKKSDLERSINEDKLNKSMLLLAIKDEELESEKEKGIQTRSMLKKVEEEKIKIENEKEKALRKMLRLKEITITQKERTITQLIYISTSVSYAAQHRFKVGGVEGRRRLRGRLSDYNGRSASGDEWYFCNLIDVADFRKAEGRIEDISGKFRDKKDKEIYIMPYRKLLKVIELICQNYTIEVSTLNAMLKDIVDEFEDDAVPLIPDAIPQSTFKITRVEFGKNVDTTIIQGKATKAQLIKEFEKYIQTLSVDENEINRKELFDDLSRLYNFNRNDAWVWLKEFIENQEEKTFILKYR